MAELTSADGTRIAYERTGTGPAVILVDGAMCYRAAGPMRPLAEQLRGHCTVYTYDRRGRGESGDTAPYAVEREVEDLSALVAAAGGSAGVHAMSSGGGLALAAAATVAGITRVSLYEPPFTAEVEDDTRAKEYTARLTELLGAGRDGDAVALFMTLVGMPEPAVAAFRASPGWAVLSAIAPTLAYDDQVMTGGRVPADLAARITVPVLLLDGADGPPVLRAAAKAVAGLLPTATHRTLDGQTHDVAPEALAPVLAGFFTA